jgi:hypothetical protein
VDLEGAVERELAQAAQVVEEERVGALDQGAAVVLV